MIFAAFASASTTKTSLGAWTHPSTDPGFLTPEYYIRLAQELERGGVDILFFDDRLAMPAAYGGSTDPAVERGSRVVKLDLISILGLLAGHTERLGLGATYSTTYGAPYHVARQFATLDHLSKGRVIWNIVTSLNVDEAENFGATYLKPEERYDRADEFLEATTGLWDTWDDDALVLDRTSGVFADPDKVRALDHDGEWFQVQGPLTVPRSPQGRPLLMQAGSSGRGREFAARWAELIFTGDPNIDVARSHYKDQKERIGQGGRDPSSVKMLPMAYTVIGESAAHAQEREQVFLNELVDPQASLTLLSELMNHDFSGMALDDPITDELVESVSGIRGLVQNLRQHIGESVTLGDLAGHRATLLQGPRFVGPATDVVDQMEEWFEGDACDGFVVAATHVPGAYEDVVRLVVPELQRRELFRTRYTGTTLRDTLGLDRPAAATRA